MTYFSAPICIYHISKGKIWSVKWVFYPKKLTLKLRVSMLRQR
jgi:hypothetical protein